jgi:hypothetical protein
MPPRHQVKPAWVARDNQLSSRGGATYIDRHQLASTPGRLEPAEATATAVKGTLALLEHADRRVTQ